LWEPFYSSSKIPTKFIFIILPLKSDILHHLTFKNKKVISSVVHRRWTESRNLYNFYQIPPRLAGAAGQALLPLMRDPFACLLQAGNDFKKDLW
jgi:hypothetical protein